MSKTPSHRGTKLLSLHENKIILIPLALCMLVICTEWYYSSSVANIIYSILKKAI